MIARVLLGLGVLQCATAARAVPERYSPFEPGERVQLAPLIALEPERGEYPKVPRHDVFLRYAEKNANLGIDWLADGTAVVTLSRERAKLFSGPLKGYGSAAVGAGVYTADLNADGLPDYAIITHSGGCGLAAQETWVTFLLSTSGGYISTCVPCWDAEPADFIHIKGKVYLVHTSFRQGNVGKDGKPHNYWVYNLLSFRGTELVLANDRDRRFPKWVWYSFAENHRETDQLTAAQRELSLKQILEAD